MEDLLRQIGLTAKEAHLYILLLNNGRQTATALARLAGEKRTNTYALLENLQSKGLVDRHGDRVNDYGVTDPSMLEALVTANQQRVNQASASLRTAMPKLKSQYSLTTNKPGVVHMAGRDGFLRLLDDMVRSTTEVLLIASNEVPADEATLQAFRERLHDRKAAGVATRAIFHKNQDSPMIKKLFAGRGIEVRFLGESAFVGEVALYEDNTAFTVYKPSLIVTILTNAAIAQTMRTMFEELWQQAD